MQNGQKTVKNTENTAPTDRTFKNDLFVFIIHHNYVQLILLILS